VRRLAPLLLAALLALLAGCGDDAGEPAPASSDGDQANEARDAASAGDGAEQKPPEPKGTEVVLGDSEFGEMLYDARDQAIYVFERDSEDRSNCYGECAAAWPPVLTEGEPVAGAGVDEELLGTTKRDDGSTQVTYAGRPLYFYAHEAPGEVRCHNVDLNGGLWWVVGADGEPLA
jgi:predicted lipoprotein with Yx(FWY)xxD motif